MALEEAIALARASAFQDGDSIIIDRGRKNGTTRKRSRDIEESESLSKDKKRDDGREDANFWRKKYNEIKKLRDEAEDDLELQIQKSKERESALEKYSNLLLQKIGILQSESGKLGGVEGENGLDKLEAQRKLLRFLELMTSMTVKDEGHGSMVCTLKNRVKRNVTRFQIKDNGGDEVQYIPKANISLLPEYLQSELSFERNMAPVLLADALQALYDDSEDNENK